MGDEKIKLLTKRACVALFAFTILLSGIVAPIAARSKVFASGEAITGTEPINATAGSMNILSDIQISGSSDDVINVRLYIPSGWLGWPISTPSGLTFTGDDEGNLLRFSGTRSAVNTALQNLQFGAGAPSTQTLEISLTSPNQFYNPANGHVYEVVLAPDNGDGYEINWGDAKTAAEAREAYGANGYLATISSQEENDFVTSRLSDDGWFGASDSANEGDWKWVTGPEATTSFWSGATDGTAVSGRYSNWDYPNQPDNAGGDPGEDCGQILHGTNGKWNDLPCDNDLQNYIVEHGALGDMPVVPYAEKTINITAAEVEVASCQDLQMLDSNSGRPYAHFNLTQNIDCEGGSVNPQFTSGDFSGTFDGNEHTISNVVLDKPEEYCVGLFSETDDAEITDLKLDNFTTTGAESVGTLIGCAENTNVTSVEATNINVSTEYGYSGGLIGEYNAEDGDEANLTNSSASGNVMAQGGYDIGGLVGDAWSEDGAELHIQKVFADVTVSVTSVENENIGGLIGFLELDLDNDNETPQVTLSDAYAWGTVDAPGNWDVGGLIGEASFDDDENDHGPLSLDIERAYFNGDIIGYQDAGGLIGRLDGLDNEFDGAYTLKDSFVTGGTITSDPVGGALGGLVGVDDSDDGTVVYDNNYIDQTATSLTDCVSNKMPSNAECMAINTDGTEASYFINNTTNPPLDQFDFEDTWITHSDTPPTFIQADEETSENSVRFVSPQTGKDVVLQLSDECNFETQFKAESELVTNDTSFDYPNGLVGFEADCGTPGFTTSVTQYYLDVELSSAIVRKYSSLINGYFTLDDATIEQTTYEGTPATKVTYQVTDGSERDMDGVTDGNISDPAGLGISTVSTPNTGLQGTWILNLKP